jgi:hypothetical protein
MTAASRQDLLVDAAEGAGRHHQHHVAIASPARDALCDGVEVVDLFGRDAVVARAAPRSSRPTSSCRARSAFRSAACERRADDHAVGFMERVDVAASNSLRDEEIERGSNSAQMR